MIGFDCHFYVHYLFLEPKCDLKDTILDLLACASILSQGTFAQVCECKLFIAKLVLLIDSLLSIRREAHLEEDC